MDPAWYFSAPGLTWAATLKITKAQLQLLSDPDILLMIEVVSEEESQQYLTTTLKPTTSIWELIAVEESKFISYLDANNLYGWAMSKQLSTSGIK